MKSQFVLLICLTTSTVTAQVLSDSKARPAAAEIIRQFDHFPIVMLGEIHGSIQFDNLLKELVNTPAFAEKVNDIVVEMGNSLYQPVLDAYISGEDVPPEKLRSVWQNLVGAPGGTPMPPYHGLFKTVRDLNQRLQPARRLRILAGDPPINWDHVRAREDIAPFLSFRDEHFGSVVRFEVLAKRRKALLIMGARHFQRREGRPGLIEQQVLGSFAKAYVVIAGSDVVRTYDDLDPRFLAVNNASVPWLMEMKGTWLGGLPRWQDAPLIGFPALGSPGSQTGTWEQSADAFLFLGPRDQMTTGGEQFDLENDPYGVELRRRWKILFPKPPTALPKADGSVRPLFQRITTPPPAVGRPIR